MVKNEKEKSCRMMPALNNCVPRENPIQRGYDGAYVSSEFNLVGVGACDGERSAQGLRGIADSQIGHGTFTPVPRT